MNNRSSCCRTYQNLYMQMCMMNFQKSEGLLKLSRPWDCFSRSLSWGRCCVALTLGFVLLDWVL